MQKALVASALLLAAANAATTVCVIKSGTATVPTECTDKMALKTVAAPVEWNPANTHVFGEFTTAAATTCAELTADNTEVGTCVAVVLPDAATALVAPSADESACLAATAQGASAACAAKEGATCSTTAGSATVCETGTTCQSGTCQKPAATTTINCVVATAPAASCDNIAVTLAPPTGVTLTPTGAIFATFTYTPATGTTATCANLNTVDPTTATCVTATTPSATTPAQDSCLVTTATQGASAACGAGADAACSATVFCAPTFTCDATSKKCTAPVTTVKYSWSGLGVDSVDAFNTKVTETFPAEVDAANACSGLGLTFTAPKVYKSQDVVFFTSNKAIPAACLTAQTSIKTDASTCATACGSEGCLCEAGDACVVSPTSTAGNCESGLECKDGVCNNSVVATAAFAVAAALLAVIF